MTTVAEALKSRVDMALQTRVPLSKHHGVCEVSAIVTEELSGLRTQRYIKDLSDKYVRTASTGLDFLVLENIEIYKDEDVYTFKYFHDDKFGTYSVKILEKEYEKVSKCTSGKFVPDDLGTQVSCL